MKRISDVLSPLVRRCGLEEGVILEGIRRDWHTIFHEPLSLHISPSSLKDKELLITVDSPLWLQEVSYRKAQILKNLDHLHVKRVRFRLGKVTPLKAPSPSQKQQGMQAPLDSETLHHIEHTASGIKDSAVRSTFRRAMERSLAHRGKR